jgi:hypothetical protein
MINEALSMGWMVLALLVGLLIYFQVSISDPVAKKRATFKTFIGIIAAFLLFLAIANYKTNFYGESRLLPVSLVIVTATTFVMALYFTNLAALLKIGGFMFFVAAFLSGYGNWLPQVEGGFPPKEEKLDFSSMTPQQLADEGEKIIFGGIGRIRCKGRSARANAPSAMRSTPGCWENARPTCWACPSGQAKSDWKTLSIQRAIRPSVNSSIKKRVPAAELQRTARSTLPSPMPVPTAMSCPATA